MGGGVQSEAWRRIIAAATGLTLLAPADGDDGAARLAAACATGDRSTRIFSKPRPRPRPRLSAAFRPDPRLAEAYGEKRRSYRRTHPALKAVVV